MRDEVQATEHPGSSAVPLEQSITASAKLWIGLAIASAVIALVLLPPFFGGLGIFFGYLARRSGSQRSGVLMMYISGAAMVFGMIFGVLVAVLS